MEIYLNTRNGRDDEITKVAKEIAKDPPLFYIGYIYSWEYAGLGERNLLLSKSAIYSTLKEALNHLKKSKEHDFAILDPIYCFDVVDEWDMWCEKPPLTHKIYEMGREDEERNWESIDKYAIFTKEEVIFLN